MNKNVMALLSVTTCAVGLTASTAFSGEIPMGDMTMGVPQNATEEEITFGAPGQADAVTRTITVTMQDLAYDLKNIKAKDGETIRFIIINKDDVGHEFTMGTAEMNASDREKMAKMMDMGQEMSMAGEANAVTVLPQQTKELVWTFKGPSQIEFACNIPGHFESGMKGKIMIMKQ